MRSVGGIGTVGGVGDGSGLHWLVFIRELSAQEVFCDIFSSWT